MPHLRSTVSCRDALITIENSRGAMHGLEQANTGRLMWVRAVWETEQCCRPQPLKCTQAVSLALK
eukprot:1142431-Pelagomonas_calceolata.AAC.9